jgi:A/G-specific adenine glycosylase
VLSRIHGWTEENNAALWTAAEKLARAGEPRIVNQALMELGAKVCSFRSPRCLLCPVQGFCAAYKTGMQDQIPPVKKRPETVHVHIFAVVQKQDGRYLMKPSDGMWEVPTFPELPEGDLAKVGSCRHTITHHRLAVSVYVGQLHRTTGYEWTALTDVPVSSLTRKIIQCSGRSVG